MENGSTPASDSAPAASGVKATSASRKKTAVIASVVTVLLVLLAVIAWQAWRSAELERRVTDLESVEPTAEAEPSTEPTTEPEPTPEPTETPEPAAPETGENDGRYIGYVKRIYNVGSTRYVEIDYIQFLTGDEAADAAAARGDESPPPNDYYIVNENPRLRQFPVQMGIPVTMWTWAMESSGVSEQDVLFDIWWDRLFMSGDARLQAVPYWIELEDGVITSIEEQYLP